MKRKRPIRTPEERARSEEVERQLRERIESIRAELRAKGKEPIEDIQYWIERLRIELATGKRPAA